MILALPATFPDTRPMRKRPSAARLATWPPNFSQTMAYMLRVRLQGCVLFEMVVGVPPFVSDRLVFADMILGSPLPRPARGANGDVVRLSRDFRDLLEGLRAKFLPRE